jgi:hypothetical protein
MKVRIESALAARWNEEREIGEDGRPDTWEGEVPQMGPEEIFRFFNRVDKPDSDRLAGLGYELPSMSVGDIITIDGMLQYRVDPVGFTRVSQYVTEGNE